MSAAPAGHARASFDLKSASLPLITVVLKTPNLATLSQELQARFGETPDFFDEDPAVIVLTQIAQDPTPLSFSVLLTLLKHYRLRPFGIHGGSLAHKETAAAVGLMDLPEISSSAVAVPGDAPAPAPAPAAAPAVAAPASGTMVIDRPLRSGQQVYARGCDLIVLQAVNFGAEIIADGNIHVYAPLRGRAIAGARGNTDARIFSTCMEAQLISIAGIYRTSEVALPADVLGKPAQVRLAGESLVLDPI
ncbi:septum site-determining protein MinC [Pseudorhodoferax sp. Leaf265]|uniref:septum site-determining protein MinC n=1 Tax=Pseudorhodoferax sp. Leaf265 TaxID=1736315 RepID=UPI0006F972CB|nr:septum site-determining protein MinC [Pseudorhodoferax sp. Leaf265]KQP02807.1 septum site-determining protein MinC [Pseudorhodoferax sp. Leaf265]PZP95570.1 MAG: septum site-determining protein MinC [Variovorax paradoxus]PZQ06438.1 MAG: septum site-determining protein MinC [Variovorax paradoxus]